MVVTPTQIEMEAVAIILAKPKFCQQASQEELKVDTDISEKKLKVGMEDGLDIKGAPESPARQYSLVFLDLKIFYIESHMYLQGLYSEKAQITSIICVWHILF